MSIIILDDQAKPTWLPVTWKHKLKHAIGHCVRPLIRSIYETVIKRRDYHQPLFLGHKKESISYTVLLILFISCREEIHPGLTNETYCRKLSASQTLRRLPFVRGGIWCGPENFWESTRTLWTLSPIYTISFLPPEKKRVKFHYRQIVKSGSLILAELFSLLKE